MEDITINSYDELIEVIDKISTRKISIYDNRPYKMFFRGHENKDWKLIPALLRKKNICEYKELSNVCEVSIDKKSEMTLAVAQHYGKRTRCLDFTRNYKIALYFACNENNDDYEKDGALFILNETYHLPTRFTNYLFYYTAINPNTDVSSWDYAEFIISKKEVIDEFKRTGRSFDIGDVNSEIQVYLGKGFMVDFENNDYGFDRIKKQEAAMYYFGSKYYTINDGKKHYAKIDNISMYWSSDNHFRIQLHKLSNPNLEKNNNCTKIIIPQRLKKEFMKIINIKASDLEL